MVTSNYVNPNNAAANTLQSPNKRISSKYDKNVTLDAADVAAVLDIGYPIGYNESTGNHGKWIAPDPSVFVVDIASRTGGTWGMTINTLVIANTVIAWNATAAVVAELLRVNGYNATVALDTKVYTITFDDPEQVKTIPSVLSGDVTQLTGGSADATATATAGTSTNGLNKVRGFVNPNQTQVGTETGSVALVVLTGTDTLCTATQTTPHNLTTGMSLTVSGASEAKLNITATITVLTTTTFTYAVAAVAGGTVDSGAYTTTNDTMAVIMVKGEINAAVATDLVAVGDVTALQTALKDGLIGEGIVVQGLAGTF